MAHFLAMIYRVFARRFLFVVILLVFGLQATKAAPQNPTSTSPVDGATNVGRETDLTLTFPSTTCFFPAAGISLKKTFDGSYSYALSGGVDNNSTIVIPIDITLESNTSYYVDVPVSKFSTCDYNFANASNAFTVSFTTGTCTGTGVCSSCFPTGGMVCCGTAGEGIIKHLSPPDNAHFMQSYEGLSITFNGNTSVATGNITIKKYSDDTVVETIDVTSNQVTGWGTNTITINPSVNLLENGTQYYVNFPIDGYRTAADKDSWNFWTKTTPNTFSGTGL